jgi:hypothetical protein
MADRNTATLQHVSHRDPVAKDAPAAQEEFPAGASLPSSGHRRHDPPAGRYFTSRRECCIRSSPGADEAGDAELREVDTAAHVRPPR